MKLRQVLRPREALVSPGVSRHPGRALLPASRVPSCTPVNYMPPNVTPDQVS
jgi:hypothetical protein